MTKYKFRKLGRDRGHYRIVDRQSGQEIGIVFQRLSGAYPWIIGADVWEMNYPPPEFSTRHDAAEEVLGRHEKRQQA